MSEASSLEGIVSETITDMGPSHKLITGYSRWMREVLVNQSNFFSLLQFIGNSRIIEPGQHRTVIDYVYELTIPRTFDGYLSEKSVVHDTLAKKFPDVVFEETNPDLDHAGDIDFIGRVGNKAFGLQIKPVTAQASLGNFSATARMEQSFRDFERQFGGRVFIVYSIEDRIHNKEVIDQIDAEIIRLRKKP